MGITLNFTRDDIKRRFDNFLNEVEKAQVELLEYLGEKCVIEARTNHTYQDQTGALTASIGYMVFKNGEAIKENFETKGQTPDFIWKVGKEGRTSLKGGTQSKKETPEKGAENGKALAEKIGAEHNEGLSLVVVAGMNYALFVEAKGFNVLASAEHLAEQELPRMLADLVSDIKNSN